MILWYTYVTDNNAYYTETSFSSKSYSSQYALFSHVTNKHCSETKECSFALGLL